MNLRQLTYFQKIAELRSFTRAANVLHIAQPSLSRQIQQLESELGVLLFVRSDKGAMPTEAGMALQERANAVLQQFRDIRDEIGLQARVAKGELRFGLPPSLFDLITVPMVCEFRRRNPNVQLLVTEGVSAALHERVLTGSLDTAVVSDAEPLGMLRSHPVLREQLYLVASRGADIDGAEELPVSSLAEHPLILTSRPNAMRLIVDKALAECGNHVTPVVEADSSRLLCELVANGQGCTVLPFSAVYEASRDGRVKLRETISEVARRQIAEGLWRGAVALD